MWYAAQVDYGFWEQCHHSKEKDEPEHFLCHQFDYS